MKDKKNFMLVVIGICAAVAITICGIIFKQKVLRIAPLYISLIIMYLNSKVDRKALLLAGINSVLYAIVYFTYKLYASSAYALLISFPMQIIAFIRWNKNQYDNSTMLHTLSLKQKSVITIGFIVCWLLIYKVLSVMGSSYLLWDNTMTLVGILATILTMLAYIEYTYLTVLTNLCSICLYVAMIPENPEQTTYLIFSIYATICTVVAVSSARRLYKEQQKQKI